MLLLTFTGCLLFVTAFYAGAWRDSKFSETINLITVVILSMIMYCFCISNEVSFTSASLFILVRDMIVSLAQYYILGKSVEEVLYFAIFDLVFSIYLMYFLKFIVNVEDYGMNDEDYIPASILVYVGIFLMGYHLLRFIYLKQIAPMILSEASISEDVPI